MADELPARDGDAGAASTCATTASRRRRRAGVRLAARTSTRCSARTATTAMIAGSTAGDAAPGTPRSSREVLAHCERAARARPAAAFDARATRARSTRPGYVKGWAVDARGGALARPAPGLCVDAGGDIASRAAVRGGSASATRASASSWPPCSRSRDAAVATSGGLRARRPHRRPAHGPARRAACSRSRSAGPTSARADAYATAAFAMGEDGPAWTARSTATRR